MSRMGWKVIFRLLDDRLVSPLARTGETEYRIDEWVSPRLGLGPLCVFDVKEDAFSFALSTDEIFSCEYEPISQKKRMGTRF